MWRSLSSGGHEARVSVGVHADQEEHTDIATQLWTTDNVPETNPWDTPDFQEKFKTLWQVSVTKVGATCSCKAVHETRSSEEVRSRVVGPPAN